MNELPSFSPTTSLGPWRKGCRGEGVIEPRTCTSPDLHMRSGESWSKPSGFELPQHDSFCSRPSSDQPEIWGGGHPRWRLPRTAEHLEAGDGEGFRKDQTWLMQQRTSYWRSVTAAPPCPRHRHLASNNPVPEAPPNLKTRKQRAVTQSLLCHQWVGVLCDRAKGSDF